MATTDTEQGSFSKEDTLGYILGLIFATGIVGLVVAFDQGLITYAEAGRWLLGAIVCIVSAVILGLAAMSYIMWDDMVGGIGEKKATLRKWSLSGALSYLGLLVVSILPDRD